MKISIQELTRANLQTDHMLEAHSPDFVRRIISFHGLGRSHTLIVAPGSSPYEFDTSCKSLGYVLMGSRFLIFWGGKF